jgi:hypothetical protein
LNSPAARPYPFLRTNSQNPRGSTILMPADVATSSRSRSPVTSTSARLSIAEANTHWSSGSRRGIAARLAGRGATSCSRRKSTISLTVRGGRPIRLLSTRPSSRTTTSLVTRVCSPRTTRSTSAHSPRVAKALTKTFVSRKTLKRRRARHPRPSGTRAPRQTAALYAGGVRISAGSTDAEAHHAQAHFGSGQSACKAGRVACPTPRPAGWSPQISCHTVYYNRPIEPTALNGKTATGLRRERRCGQCGTRAIQGVVSMRHPGERAIWRGPGPQTSRRRR